MSRARPAGAPAFVSALVCLALIGASSCGSSSSRSAPLPTPSVSSVSQATCGSPQLVSGEPAVAVIVIDGIGSQEAGGTYDPLPGSTSAHGIPVVTSYCPIDAKGQEQKWPPGLSDSLRRWSEFHVPGTASGGSSAVPDSSKACEAGGGLGTSSCLVGELASAGAVILPFSYAGAILHSDGSFQFNGYSTDDSGEPIVISAALLAKEIQSVAQVWPHTRVVVVGHSDGGLVAESWWEGRSSFRDSQVVAKVFSLDSPINGGPNCLRTAVVYKSVAPTWCSSWQDLTTGRVVDARIIAADSDGSYTSVGKTDDPTYGDGLLSLGGGIAAQVVMQCNSDLTGTTCVAPQPISVVLGPQTSPQCENGQADLYGTTDHDVVKVCPTVVNLIVSAVQQAMSTNRSASPTPVPTPTSPAPTTPPQPAPTSTASGDPSSALRFASPGAIAAFLNSQGIACTDYMDADASSVETGAQAEGFCNVAANDVALLTFAGGDGQSQWKAGLRSLSAPGCAAGDTGPDATTTFVLGANWAVYVNGTTDLPSRQLTAQIASVAGTSPAQVCLSH